MKAWLQLFRVPNLLTVPGDPLAAFLIVTGGQLDARVVPAMIASLCLYMAGLAMNDLADAKEDLRDRPRRPIPSGAVSKSAAWIAVVALSALGLGVLAANAKPIVVTLGAVLLGHIALYNFITKRIPLLGALNMGLCRALSVALGAVMVEQPDYTFSLFSGALPGLELQAGAGLSFFNEQGRFFLQCALAGGVLIGLYIAAVTNLARHETKAEYPGLARMLPVGTLLIGYLALKQVTRQLLLDQSPTLWVVAIVLAAMTTSQLMRQPAPPLPPRIGSFIRLLPILQASLCLARADAPTALNKTPDALLCAVLLLLCVPLHSWLGKKFYAS